MILIMGLKYQTKDTKTHDIFLILCMTGYWEIDINKYHQLTIHSYTKLKTEGGDRCLVAENKIFSAVFKRLKMA